MSLYIPYPAKVHTKRSNTVNGIRGTKYEKNDFISNCLKTSETPSTAEKPVLVLNSGRIKVSSKLAEVKLKTEETPIIIKRYNMVKIQYLENKAIQVYKQERKL